MLLRADFIFTIGYDGPVAVVDRKAKSLYSSLSTRELAEKGLFRAAYSSAVYSKDPEELKTVMELYNKATGAPVSENAPLERLFGVFPAEVKRAIAL